MHELKIFLIRNFLLQVTTITRPGSSASIVRETSKEPVPSTLHKVSAKNQKLSKKIEEKSKKIDKRRNKIDQDTSSRRPQPSSSESERAYDQSDASVYSNDSYDSNHKNIMFSSNSRAKCLPEVSPRQHVGRFGAHESKPNLERIERVVRNQSSSSSDDEIIQKLKYKQRKGARELKEGDRDTVSLARTHLANDNHPSRRKSSPEYTRVSSTSFIQNYIPAVCEPPVSGKNMHSREDFLNDVKYHSQKSSPEHIPKKGRISPKKDFKDKNEKHRETNRGRKDSWSEDEKSKKRSEKTSGEHFYGRNKKHFRDESLERRIELNKDSSRRLMKNEHLGGKSRSSSPRERIRNKDKKSRGDRTRRKSSSSHSRPRKGRTSVTSRKKEETKRKKRSRSKSHRRKRSSSSNSSDSDRSNVSSKKIQSREMAKKKRKRTKDSEDDEPTFKSTKITLTVLPEKSVPVTSISASTANKEIVSNYSPTTEKVESKLEMRHSTEVKTDQNQTIPSQHRIKSEEADIGAVHPHEDQFNQPLKTESPDCGDEKSTLRERLKPLLEKKNLNPLQPEVPFRNVKIDVKPETSAVLNSIVPIERPSRKPLSISVKSPSATQPTIKKNLALSNFLSTARKEMLTSKPEIVIPKEKGSSRKVEKKEESDEESEEESEARVYQGCANLMTEPSEEEVQHSDKQLGSLSFVLNSLKPPPPFAKPGDINGQKEPSEFVESQQSDDDRDHAHSPEEALTGSRVSQEFEMQASGENGEQFEQEDVEEEAASDSEEEINYFCAQAQEFLKSGLTEDVVLELDQLYADGFLTDPLSLDVIDNLSKLSEELSLFIMQQFRDSDFTKVRNNGLFFKGKVKLATLKGNSLMDGSAKAKPAKEIALQKAKILSAQALKNSEEIDKVSPPFPVGNNETPSPGPLPEHSGSEVVPSSGIAPEDDGSKTGEQNPEVLNDPEPKAEELEETTESEILKEEEESVPKSEMVLENKSELAGEPVFPPKLESRDSAPQKPNQPDHKSNSKFNDFATSEDKQQSDFMPDVFDTEKPVKTDVSENSRPSVTKTTSEESLVFKCTKVATKPSVAESSKVTASTAPFAKVGVKAVTMKAKPELTELREKKVGSEREEAQMFNDEVAVLNQILFCGAGPSNYVPHQEGQYTPTKVNPDYHKLQHIIQVTQYNFDTSNPFVRCFGPPLDWQGPPPSQDCKLFVGKLPCDVFEDDLIPVFFEAGNVYEMRVLVDEVTSLNKGFCFVTMCTRIETDRAIKLLHGRLIKPRHKMIVRREIKFNQLFIGNLPTEKTEEEIAEAFSKIYTGITELDLVYKSKDCGNSGFCIFSFESFEAARNVRDIIQSNPYPIESWSNYRDYCADWAIPNEVVKLYFWFSV